MQLSGGKNSGPLLITALILALLFAVYYYVVLPKQEEATEKQNAVNHLTSETATMKDQIALIKENRNDEVDSGLIIRQKLPADREIDQLLLALEEAEYVSGSRILTITFNNYDNLVSESGLLDPNAPTGDEQADGAMEESERDETTDNSETNENIEDKGTPESDQTGGTAVEETEQEAVPISTMSAEALPANLKLLPFQVDIESPDAEQLQQFMKEIEQMERVMHIDTIEYSLPGEEDALTEKGDKVVSASIQVTTFYFE